MQTHTRAHACTYTRAKSVSHRRLKTITTSICLVFFKGVLARGVARAGSQVVELGEGVDEPAQADEHAERPKTDGGHEPLLVPAQAK